MCTATMELDKREASGPLPPARPPAEIDTRHSKRYRYAVAERARRNTEVEKPKCGEWPVKV